MISLFSLIPEYVDECIHQARERIRSYFENNKQVIVNFSFGKDSLLLTLLCYEVALQRNELEKLVLQTVELDDFLQHENAIRWGNYVKQRIPVKWILFRPTKIVHPIVLTIGLGQYAPSTLYPRCPWKNIYKTRALTYKRSLLGLRREESARRNNLILNTSDLTFVPLHDVSDDCLWSYLEKNVHRINIDFNRLLEFYEGKKRDGCLFCPYNNEGYDHQWQYELVARYRFFKDMLIKDNILAYPIHRRKFFTGNPRIPFEFRYTYLLDEIRNIERNHNIAIITDELQAILDELRQFNQVFGETYYWSAVKRKYDSYLQYALRPEMFKSWFVTRGGATSYSVAR